MVIQDFGEQGGRPPYPQKIIHAIYTGYTLVWIGEQGDDPRDKAEPWQIPTQGGPPFVQNSDKARHDGLMRVNTFRGRYGGRGPRTGGEIIPTPSE